MKRVELWVPDGQLEEFDESWKSKFGSRAEAVRTAMRDFIVKERNQK